MKIIDIFSQKKRGLNEENHLWQLVSCIKENIPDSAVLLLSKKHNFKNPIAISYLPEDVRLDFSIVRKIWESENLSDNELAALSAVCLMKLHPKTISNTLSGSGYVAPSLDRTIFLSTYFSTLHSLSEFSSIGVKKFKVCSCGDERVCPKCAQKNGKTHNGDKAVIGKTVPPFCEKCRCIITPVF